MQQYTVYGYVQNGHYPLMKDSVCILCKMLTIVQPNGSLTFVNLLFWKFPLTLKDEIGVQNILECHSLEIILLNSNKVHIIMVFQGLFELHKSVHYLIIQVTLHTIQWVI